MRQPASVAAASIALSLTAACAAAPEGPPPRAGKPDTSFLPAKPVTIAGYAGDAMEPFLARDGSVLFFNNRNDPADETDIHWAEAIDADTFAYRGTVSGADMPRKLDGVPSMSADGMFYFTSLRSYDEDRMSIWRGTFADGALEDVSTVPGSVNVARVMWVNMDSEVSADGQTLYTTDSWFDPIRRRIVESNLVIAQVTGFGFDRAPDSANQLANINSAKLEYAPSLSRDLKTLYFTRADFEALAAGDPNGFQTLVATRESTVDAWSIPRPIAAIEGYAEAPTLSPDECSLYFHKKAGERFVIMRTSREDCASNGAE